VEIAIVVKLLNVEVWEELELGTACPVPVGRLTPSVSKPVHVVFMYGAVVKSEPETVYLVPVSGPVPVTTDWVTVKVTGSVVFPNGSEPSDNEVRIENSV